MKAYLTSVPVLALLLISFAAGGLNGDDARPTVSVRFSPNGGIQDEVIRVIRSARTQISIAMYVFTNIEIADELAASVKRGVKVFVILDRASAPDMKSSVHDYLTSKGVNLKLTGSPKSESYSGSKMHNKFMIADHVTVVTGSYNFTHSAEESNDENIVIFRNAPQLASLYYIEFLRIWRQSK